MYLLDTSVLSEIMKQRPHEGVIRRLRQQSAEALFTAAICVMELRYGAALRADRDTFWQRIEEEILSRVQVIGFGQREALAAGDLLVHLKRAGKPVGLEDVMIAATARAYSYTVVTRNVRHFNHLPGVRIEDWHSD